MGYKDPVAQREYQRLWMANRRRSFFEGKSCVACGSSGPLELDHVEPELKIEHKIWSWSKARRTAELAKCQILCAPCHARKTASEIVYTPCGTTGSYKRGCRCDECKRAGSERMKKWRRDRKAAGLPYDRRHKVKN